LQRFGPIEVILQLWKGARWKPHLLLYY